MQLDNQFEKLSISSHSDISQNDDHYGLFEDPFRSLLWRSKSAHLTFSEKRWIYMHYKNTGDSINTISQRTGTSISTIRRIILSFSRNVKRSEIFSKIRWNRLIDSKVVSKSISKFISSQTGCYTSRDVQDHIYNSLSVMIPLHKIRKYLKQKEHLSYKKGNPRPIDLDFGRVYLLKKLFWIKIADKLSKNKGAYKHRWEFNYKRYIKEILMAKNRGVMLNCKHRIQKVDQPNICHHNKRKGDKYDKIRIDKIRCFYCISEIFMKVNERRRFEYTRLRNYTG